MKLFLTSTLLLALLLVVNVAHGCDDVGEERGKKAIEALVGLKNSNGEQKFDSIVKDFKFKPNQWKYLDINPTSENEAAATTTTTSYFIKDFGPKSSQLQNDDEASPITYFVKDFVPKPNHVLQWHHGAASHDDEVTSVKYFVKDFVPKPNHVLQWHHGAASHDDEVSTTKYFVRDFEPKINHVLQWHHGAANPTKDVWPTIKSIVTGFEFN